jgi:dynactin 1
VGICELRGKLRDFSNLNRRFAAILTRCQADEWTGFGKVLSELGGVENRVDGWISTIRSDEFSEKDCARELARWVLMIYI